MAEAKPTEKKVKENTKFAVIRTGGKQYIVKENLTLEVELLEGENGSKVEFETLLVADGDKVEIGEPLVKTKVAGTILDETKADKLIIFKYRRRKNYRVKTGHRQHLTKVKIDKI